MTRIIFSFFIIFRVFLLFIAYLGQRFIPFSPTFPYSDVYLIPSKLPRWVWSFANFDGVHYLTIIREGYWAEFTQVFFPLYPLFIRLFSSIFYWINPIVIGLIMTNLLFLFAMFIFYKLLKLDYSEKYIKWCILFLVFFPTSFFYGSLYTESLFLLLVFLAFYMARKKRWWISAILGGLASATRLVGIFLLPALLWEWHKNIKYQKSNIKNIYNLSSIFHFLSSPVLYLMPMGLISYMVYLQFTFGDALYFWHVQPVFGAERSGQSIVFLPQVLFRYFKILTSVSYTTNAFWVAFSELFFTLFAIFMLVIGHRIRLRVSYLIFSWISVIIPTMSGTLSSMPRYILVAFPIYIILGMIQNKLIKSVLLLLSLVLLTVYTIIFTSGLWVA